MLTKVLECGRLMAYLEQSTRYVPYTDTPHGRWRYHVPAELEAARCATNTSGRWMRRSRSMRVDSDRCRPSSSARHPRGAGDSDAVYRSAIRAKALDTLRGLLPAATQSNVGLYGTGQAYEALLLRMRAHPLAEVAARRRRCSRSCAR